VDQRTSYGRLLIADKKEAGGNFRNPEDIAKWGFSTIVENWIFKSGKSDISIQ